MNPFNLLRGQNRRRASNQGNDHNFIGATSFRDWNPGYSFLNHFHSDGYDSAYPSIRAISNEYMTILPYAINAKVERVENNPVINALYHPNQQDSAVSFFEKMAVSTLFHKRTYILVWRKEGGIAKPGGDFGRLGVNIAGFTYLEFPAVERRDGRTYYKVGAQEFNDKEVIVLPGGVHPNDLYNGYSPSEASRKWGKLDDYIADYQGGFFENNAIPAGEFVITAPTSTEYNDIVDKLQSRHKGAGKNNNVTYTHRPVDPENGKPTNAQIEWISFGQSNKDIDFKNLFEQVNKRIDVAYGVPAIVKGIDSAATYANAQVAEATFAKRAVRPLALRNYAQLTHELNRITGGIGVAITFKYDIPAVADEENVRAEMKVKLVTALNQLVDANYTVDQAIRALELPESFKALLDPKPADDDDAADVDEGGEVTSAPDPDEIDGVTPLNRTRKPKMQVSTRDFPDLYEGLDVDPADLGCIMVDTEPLAILSVVGDSAADDLVVETDRHDHEMGTVAEVEPHVTLLYGLLENGNTWKDKVDTVLEDWKLDSVQVKEVSYFNLPDSYAIIAHIEETTDLLDGHNRLTLLPHISTFSEYRPHMTLAYIKKEADLGKWLTTLNAEYTGKKLPVTGINYGDLPEDSEDDKLTDPKTVDKIADKLLNEAAESTRPKDNLSQDDVELYEERLSIVVRDHMSTQIEGYITALDAQDAEGDPTEAETDEFNEAMLLVIIAIMQATGDLEYVAGLSLLVAAGVSTDGVTPYTVGTSAIDDYRKYLKGVAESYGADTGASIRSILARSQTEGWDRNRLETELRGIMNTDEWRVKRLATTEVNRSQAVGSIDSMTQIEDESGAVVEKSLQHTGGDPPCEFCAAWIDYWLPVKEIMIKKNATITGTEGGVLVYTWDDNNGHDVHANGHCRPQFRVKADA